MRETFGFVCVCVYSVLRIGAKSWWRLGWCWNWARTVALIGVNSLKSRRGAPHSSLWCVLCVRRVLKESSSSSAHHLNHNTVFRTNRSPKRHVTVRFRSAGWLDWICPNIGDRLLWIVLLCLNLHLSLYILEEFLAYQKKVKCLCLLCGEEWGKWS